MRKYSIIITIFLIATVSAVIYLSDWYIFDPSKWSSKYMENPPEICREILQDGGQLYTKERNQILARVTVDDLLTLQKCGLAFHPHHQFQWNIANHPDYPVPALLKRLQTDDDEYFQYYLILAFHTLTSSKKHSARFKADRSVVISEIEDTISRMKDSNNRRLSESKYLSIKGFLDQ